VLSQQKRLFGTNGIRGIPGKDLSLEFITEIGQAIGTYFGEGSTLVGYDGRRGGSTIAKAIESALMASAINVFEAGLIPTPTLQYAVRKLGYKGGVMITASHNPPQYNGIKVVGQEGVEISREDELKIETIYYGRTYRSADWRTVGKLGEESHAIEVYMRGVLSQIDIDQIKRRNFTIVVDAGNGAQALTSPYILEDLGCRVISINGHVDEDFPGRGPEPTPDVLGGLSEAIEIYHADLGVAYDGDGDRSIFVDEKGTVNWGDRTGAFAADHVLSKKPSSLIVTTVSTSQLIDLIAKRHRSKVLRTRVGSVDVSQAMIANNALFGFEENGGCFYAPHIPVRDGAMTTAIILEALSQNDQPFSEMLDRLPYYHQRKMKIQCPRESMQKIMSEVEKQAGGRIDRTDGIKMWIDDNTWILIRPSGTEPVIRIFAESNSRDRLEQTVNKFALVLKETLMQS
jgi:phosphomannomutase/phosphoglucomutase